MTDLTWQKNKAQELTAGSASSTLGGYTVYNLTVADDHTFFVGTANGGTWVHNSCATEFHHLFPQAAEFRAQWNRLGIDADDYTMSLDRDFHQEQLHGFPRDGRGGWWNQQWRDFFANNPNASPQQAFNQMLDMVDHWGLGNKKIFRYPFAGKY